MRRPLAVWAASIGTLIVLDVWADRNAVKGDSLSECVRDVFSTHTPAGRAALIGSWAILTAWVLPHWCRPNN